MPPSPTLSASNPHGDVQSELRALNSAFAVACLDETGRVLRTNATLLRLFGCEPDAIVGRDLLRFARPNDPGRATEPDLSWSSLMPREPRAFELRRIRGDGRELWVRVTATLLDASDEGATEIVALLTDISDEKRRELTKRGQIDAIETSFGVVHFTLDGVVERANDIFLDMLGYTADEVVGRHHSLFVHPRERDDDAYRAIWSELRAGRHQTGEVRRLGKGGRQVWLQASYNPICDAAGRPFKVVKYAIDVTAEKLRQAAHESQIAALSKSTCVATLGLDGTILDANEHFLRETGYALREIEGRHHRLFVDPAYAHGAEYAAFWRQLGDGQHQSGQYRRFGKGGRELWLQATYNPVLDTDGRPVRIVEYSTVVTHDRLRQAEHQGQIAAIHKALSVISFTMDGTILDANDNFLDLTGYRISEVRGRHHRLFVDQVTSGSTEYAEFWAQLGQGQYQAGEYKRVTKDGREVWLQATYNPIFDLNGRPFRIVKYATDVTDAKRVNADVTGQISAIRKSQGVVTLDMDGTILDVNDLFLQVLGYDLAEVRGRHHSVLVEPDHVGSDEYRAFWDTLRAGNFLSGMYRRIGKNGRELWIRATYTPILGLDGKPYKIVKFATDVTPDMALAEAFEDAKRQAQHDATTALPNRVRLASFMSSALAQPGARLVVLYLDLDRFKPINDTFGHHVGDRVLGETADRLRRLLRSDQLVARVGGDEFVIAAPDLAEDEIEPFCQSLQALVAEPIRHDHGEIRVGLSIGIAVAPHDGETPDDLLRAADTALYRSKQNGRGTFSFFATDMNDRIVASRTLADDMRRGIETGQFFLEYQPRFGVREKEIRSVEALVRWSHPERGRISPANFIPLAERSGLIVPLGEWIMRTACRAAAGWSDISVSVNVSPIQFRDGDLVPMIARILAETGLAPERLEIEVTEGVLLDNAERARVTLDDMKALGIKLAIDDFGTGYASLSYLRNYPFDVIKIDRQFINDIDSREGGRAIVRAILALGKALGLSVTAEGVETTGQLAMLTHDQCAEAQGFLLARPMPEGKMSAMLEGSPDAAGARPASGEPPRLTA